MGMGMRWGGVNKGEINLNEDGDGGGEREEDENGDGHGWIREPPPLLDLLSMAMRTVKDLDQHCKHPLGHVFAFFCLLIFQGTSTT